MKRFLSIAFWVAVTAHICVAQQFQGEGWFNAPTKQQSSPLLSGNPSETAAPAPETGSGLTGSSEIAEAITPDIQALAQSLQNDPLRIYKYVHDHIRYVLYFGSKKGAQLTYLEKSGNDFDQSALLVALLRAAGYTGAAYQFGWMGIPYDNANGSHNDLHHWLGLTLTNTNWVNTSNYLARLFWNVRYYPSQYFLNDNNTFLFQRVWVTLRIGGTNYYMDPSFKVCEPVNGINLASAMSFSSNALMSAAAGTDTGNYVTNINEAALRASLTGNISNLLNYLHDNCPNSSVEEIIGTQRIVPATNTTLPTSLLFQFYTWNYPGVAVMPIVNWDNLPTNLMSRLGITVGGARYEWLMPQLQGKRISLTFDNSGIAQLWQDDTLLMQRTNTGSAGTTNVVLNVDHALGHWDYANNILIDDGYGDQVATNAYQRTNAIYALNYAFEPDWNWLQKRQQQLESYSQQGLSINSREMVTETLNIAGLNWLLQSERVGDILSRQLGVLTQYHHRIGRAAQESGHGYYVDVYEELSGFTSSAGADSTGICAENRFFDLFTYWGSALEHGIIEQLQSSSLTAASTVKMLQIANTNGQAIYFASLTNWTSGGNVKSHLINYDLSILDNYIYNGYTLLLPQNGSNRVAGAGSWAGYGIVCHYLTATDAKNIFAISGKYNGGYAALPNASIDPLYILQNGISQPDFYNPVPAGVPYAVGADPVAMADGSFHLETIDLSLGESEPKGLRLTRYYSSNRRNSNPTGMAHGWTHNYYVKADEISAPQTSLGETTPQQMASIIVATCASAGVYNNAQPSAKNWLVSALIAKWGVDQLTKNGVSITLGSDALQFIRQPDGSFTPPANCTMVLSMSNSAFNLQERHGRLYKFNTTGFLTNITDQYQNSLKVTYNSSNLVSTVTDWKNQSFTFSYTGTPLRLNSVSENTGRSVGYGYATTYNAQGDLTAANDAEGKSTTFTYGTNHLVNSVANAKSQIVTTNIYDDHGRIVQQCSQGDTNKVWQIICGEYESIERDPAGGERHYYYDDKSRLIAVRDALGYVTQTAYDGQNHVIVTVSPLGETNRFIYDGNHNLIVSIDPLGYTNQYYFDNQNNMLKSVDARGNSCTFGYNGKYQRTGSTNGAGDWINFDYSSDSGNLLSKTDAGGTTTYGYDSYGQLNAITYPGSLGGESFVNNALGDVISHTDGRGFVTTMQYNARRQLTNTVAPTNLTAKVTYDDAGNPSSRTDPRGFTTYQGWNAIKQLMATTMPSTPQGTPVVTNLYDNRDWLWRTKDPLNNAADFSYDAAGRLASTTDPAQRNSWFVFNANGQKVASTNAAGEVTSQFLSARGELIGLTDGANRIVLRAYDAVGNQVVLTNRNGKKWQFQYDGANRLTNTITPLGRSIRQGWSNRGLLTSIKEPSNQATTLGYDALGRLTNRVDDVGTTSYAYDANNNRTNVTEAGASLAWTFDAYNRLTSYRDNSGNLIKYAYDGNGNLTNLVYPGGKTVTYAYDGLNHLTNLVDWGGRSTVFVYDLAGKLTGISRPNHTVRGIAYDPAGQATNIVEQNDSGMPIALFRLNWNSAARVEWEFAAPMPHTATVPTRTMTYDDDNRLLTVNGVNVTNDADGNLTYGPLPSGTLGTYGYDARNRLLSAGGVSYGYEALGNRTSLTSGTNTTSVIVNPNASLSQVLMRIKSGVTNYYIYGQGLLYQVTETGGTTNLAVYHYDYRGSTVAITDGSGRVTDRIEYSLYGTTTYRAGNTDTPYLFNGQFGVQTDPNGLLYMRARYYNPYLCRFLNGDPVGFSGGLNWYAFANGNPISLSDPLGLDPAFSPGIGMFSGLTPAQEVQASRQAAPFVGGVVFGATVACGIIFAAPVAASALVWAGFTETAATATVSAGVYTAGGYGAYRTVASTAQSVRAGDWDAVAFNVGTLTGGSVVGINGGGRFMAESLMGKPSPAPNTLNPIAILQYEIVNSYKPSLGPPGLEYWATAPTPFSGGFSAATAASSAGTFIQPFGGASGQGGWINPSQGYNSSKIK